MPGSQGRREPEIDARRSPVKPRLASSGAGKICPCHGISLRGSKPSTKLFLLAAAPTCLWGNVHNSAEVCIQVLAESAGAYI